MKRFVCYYLILCMTILGLSACAPQEPTADVYAIQLGDTEKQVVEKAGKPHYKLGLGYDIFGYLVNQLEAEEKFIWIRDNKVVMMATCINLEFLEWEIDDSYVFEPIKQPKDISVWEPGLDLFDIIGYFGPEFSYDHGLPTSFLTYELADGGSLKIRFWSDLIRDAIYIEKDGTETVLWDLDNYTH